MCSVTRAAAFGLAVAMGCGISGSQAAVSASATFENFSIGVVDLDPHDGIAAGYTHDLGLSSVRSFARQAFASDGAFQALDENQANVVIGSLGAASVESRTGPGFGPMSIVGTAGDSFTDPHSFEATVIVSRGRFTIQPHTRLIFTADVSVAASSDNSFHFGAATLEFRGIQSSFTLDTSVDGNTSTRMNLFAETGDESVTGVLSAVVGAFGVAPPIPEPTTCMLMLGGLLALGAVTRQRKRVH
jgi:hypothetical protein